MCSLKVTFIVFNILTTPSINSQRFNNVFEKFKSTARKILGLEQATNVAKLVNEAFGKNNEYFEKKTADSVFSKFLRVLGFDVKKIGAITINAVIFVAQLISSSVSPKPLSQISEAKKLNGTPIEWFLNNTKVLRIISDAQERKLPENIIEYIKEHSLDEDTGCIQLLICKTAPLVWGMQRNINSKNVTFGKRALFEFLPEIEDFAENSDKCDKKHPYCYLNL